jgi:nucleotide-binding universal stress UspA family protein
MFKRILVPLDGSSFGEAALGPAAALARRSGGELRLLNVHEQGWNVRRYALASDYRRWREEYLAAAARGLFQLQITTVVREGRAEEQIDAEAESWGADLIVMSTHGRGGVTRLWLGSVADQCVRRSSVPLLLVRAKPSGETNAGAIYTRQRIVVPLDGSEVAMRALPLAKTLAETLGAPLALLRVVQPAATGAVSDPRDPMAVARAACVAREYLDGVVRNLGSSGGVTTQVAIDNNPAHAIIEHAEGDLVVMSTHSRSPLGRAVLGSVTDKVVRGSRGPVVVIPAASGAGSEARPESGEAGRELELAVQLPAGTVIY